MWPVMIDYDEDDDDDDDEDDDDDYYDNDNDVKESPLVFWVILEYRSTHNGGGKAALL